jgi:hypothetical protein
VAALRAATHFALEIRMMQSQSRIDRKTIELMKVQAPERAIADLPMMF